MEDGKLELLHLPCFWQPMQPTWCWRCRVPTSQRTTRTWSQRETAGAGGMGAQCALHDAHMAHMHAVAPSSAHPPRAPPRVSGLAVSLHCCNSDGVRRDSLAYPRTRVGPRTRIFLRPADLRRRDLDDLDHGPWDTDTVCGRAPVGAAAHSCNHAQSSPAARGPC